MWAGQIVTTTHIYMAPYNILQTYTVAIFVVSLSIIDLYKCLVFLLLYKLRLFPINTVFIRYTNVPMLIMYVLD